VVFIISYFFVICDFVLYNWVLFKDVIKYNNKILSCQPDIPEDILIKIYDNMLADQFR